MKHSSSTGSGEVSFSPSQLREAAEGYESRGLAPATSAAASLGDVKRFPLPLVAQELQSAIETLLSGLDEPPQLLKGMTKAFTVRANSTARAYEAVEQKNAGLVLAALNAKS